MGTNIYHYVRNAVKNREEWKVKEGRKFPKIAPTPMSSKYKPKVDDSPELSPEMANFYHTKFGVLWLIIEIGRLKISTEVNLTAVFHVFAYLKTNYIARLIYDPSYLQIESNDLKSDKY
jgi:hypothetical protein